MGPALLLGPILARNAAAVFMRPVVGAGPVAGCRSCAYAGAVRTRPGKQLWIGAGYDRAHLRCRVYLAVAIEWRAAGGIQTRQPDTGCGSGARRMGRAGTRVSGVDAEARSRRRAADDGVQGFEGGIAIGRGVASDPACCESRQLPSRAGNDDATAVGRAAGQIHGSDWVLQGEAEGNVAPASMPSRTCKEVDEAKKRPANIV